MKTLQNEQFSIKSIQEGQTIVFYHDLENPNFANYLNFYSADGLQIEKDTLTIGDFICFSSMAKDGIFKSSGPVVLEPKSGIALILGEGIIEIAHEVGKQTTRKRIIPEQPVEVCLCIFWDMRYLSFHFLTYTIVRRKFDDNLYVDFVF